MEGSCSTGQSPQRAVVPVEEKEEEEEEVEKYCRAGQATDENIAHAHCMLDT
jgi:hypothetical protein